MHSRYEDPAPQQLNQHLSAAPPSYYPAASKPVSMVHARREDPAAHQQPMNQNAYQLNERRYFEPLKRSTSASPPPVAAKPEKQGRPSNAQSPINEKSQNSNKIPYITSNLMEQQRNSADRLHLRSPSPGLLPKPQRDSNVAAMAADHQRYSGIGGAAQHQHNQPPPEELRGQLPWSYFKNRNDISGPKRTFTQLREDEDLPPVPVPDYTLHFPRKDRPSTNSSEEGGMYWLKR